MKIEQISSIVNDIHKVVTGVEEDITLDSKNVVDVGKQILDATDVDNYVKTLVNRIGKMIFNDRKYTGNGHNVLMDSWEFGSILEKVDCELPEAVENDSWKLENGVNFNQDSINKPTVTAKLFNKKVTFEIDVTFAERQVKDSFNSMNDLNAFMSMIYNAVDKSFTVKLDGLIMATINNMTAKTISSEFKDITDNNYSNSTGVKAVNLLKLYNDKFAKTLTKDSALTDSDFLKFASMTINNYVERVSKLSTLFNMEGKQRFTPKDDLNLMMLADFKSACSSYLQANTFHKELVELPNSESVPYWQGTGKDYSFDCISSINVNIDNGTKTPKNIKTAGIIAVMFDKNAVGVCNTDRRVTTYYNAKAEFFNNFFKFDCSYLNDFSENFVVFFIA